MSDPRVPEQIATAWRQLYSEAREDRLAGLEGMAVERGAYGMPVLGWYAELEDLAAEMEALRSSLPAEEVGNLDALLQQIEAAADAIIAGGAGDPCQQLSSLRGRAVAFADRSTRSGSPYPTATDRTRALEVHEAADREFLTAVADLSEEQWSFRPGPDRWSIREITEHVVIVEEFLHNLIESALASPPDPAWPTFDLPAAMVTRVLDRSVRGTAPPPMVPRGQWTTEETMEQYRATRARTRAYLERVDLPLRAHIASGPPGTFNTYHWLILVSLHHQRHNQQIAEVIAHADFPVRPSA